MHCIVMTWHWTNCRSYYHHFMTRWMCITWKHNCIACAWWTHDLYQQQSTWWAMKQELSEKFAFVIKEKKHFTVMESTVFLDESQMAKLFNTVCARRFLKTMFFLQSWNTSKKTDFTVACSIYSFMVFQAHIILCTQFYKINQIMICV